jgi:hypothetical protein
LGIFCPELLAIRAKGKHLFQFLNVSLLSLLVLYDLHETEDKKRDTDSVRAIANDINNRLEGTDGHANIFRQPNTWMLDQHITHVAHNEKHNRRKEGSQ